MENFLISHMDCQNAQTTYQPLPTNQESCDGCAGNNPNLYEHPIMASTYQLGDIKQEDCDFHGHPSDDIANLTNQDAWPLMLASDGALNLSLGQSSDFNTCMASSSHRSAPSNFGTGIVADGHEGNGYFAESHTVNGRREHPEVIRENNYIAQEMAYPNLHPEDIFSNSRQIRREGPNGGNHFTHSGNFPSEGFLEPGNRFHARGSHPRFLCGNDQVQSVEHSHGLCHNKIYCVNGEHLHAGAMGLLDIPLQGFANASVFPVTCQSVVDLLSSAFPEPAYLEDLEIDDEFAEYSSSDDSEDEDDMSHETLERYIKIRMWGPKLDLSPPDISSESVDEACVICLEEYNLRENIGELVCGHSYHVECIKKWLLRKSSCPICKQPALLPSTGGN